MAVAFSMGGVLCGWFFSFLSHSLWFICAAFSIQHIIASGFSSIPFLIHLISGSGMIVHFQRSLYP
jgi:hypothetical protein